VEHDTLQHCNFRRLQSGNKSGYEPGGHPVTQARADSLRARRRRPERRARVNNEAIIIAMLALSVVLAAAAVIQRDRELFLIWAGWSIISTILLVFIAPVLAVLKLISLVLGARHLVLLYNTIINLDQKCELAIHDVTSSLVRREAVVPRIESYVGRYSIYEASTLINTIRERGGRGAGLAVLFEAYPQLRASDQFTRLASELVAAEDPQCPVCGSPYKPK
jgi:hypothetical protein